jgi:hypothetical protein
MRKIVCMSLGVMILGGCASPSKPQGCSQCGDAAQRTPFVQRLGLGRPKAEPAIAVEAGPDTAEIAPMPANSQQAGKAQAKAEAKQRGGMLRFARFEVPAEG